MVELFPHLQGYHILLGDPNIGSEGLPPVRVVLLGGAPRLRGPSEGILLGANPEAEQLDDAARARYERVGALVADERNLNPSELEEMLADRTPGVGQNASVFNAHTRYCVVFEPKVPRLRVAVPAEDGGPGEFVRFEFEPEAAEPADEAGAETAGGGAP